MKRIISVFLVGLMILAIFSGCASQDNPVTVPLPSAAPAPTFTVNESSTAAFQINSEDNTELKDIRIGYVIPFKLGTTPGHDFMANVLLTLAEEDEGIETKVFESASPADWEPNFISAAEEGYDLIFGFTAQMKDVMIKVAEMYPDTNFVSIDNTIVGMPNVNSIMGNCNEGCFIAGAIAAMWTTRTDIPNVNADKKVGYIGGKDTPYVLDGFAGWKQGALHVDPEMEVLSSYGENFQDPMKMKELTLAQIQSGVDCLYIMTGAACAAGYEALNETQGGYAIGHDGDHDGDLPGIVITSFVRTLAEPVKLVVNDFRKGIWHGDSVYLCTFENGGMGFTDSAVFKEAIEGKFEFPDEIMEDAKELMIQVSRGEILVDEYPGFREYDRDTYPQYK